MACGSSALPPFLVPHPTPPPPRPLARGQTCIAWFNPADTLGQRLSTAAALGAAFGMTDDDLLEQVCVGGCCADGVGR